MSSSSFGGEDLAKRRKQKMAEVKKDLWKDDDGNIAEGVNGGLPKGWAKGKLLARAGQEITDAQAKEWKVTPKAKAKAPVENKAK